jgi:cobalt-zinc-cadmium efflux system membrane fusion protein
MHTMFVAKVRLTAAVVLVAGLLGIGAGLVGPAALADKPGGVKATLVAGRRDMIQVPLEELPRLGIQVAEVKARGASRPRLLRLPGVLSYDNLTHVRSRLAGEVIEIRQVKDKDGRRPLRVGDKVRKGDLLALIWNKELQSQREFLRAMWNHYLAEDERARPDKADKTEPGALGRLALRAPMDGIIVERIVTRNDFVKADDHLFTLADPSRLQVSAWASKQDAADLTALPGEKRYWTVRPAADAKGKADKGRIVSIDGDVPPQHLVRKIDRIIEDMWHPDGKKLLDRIDPAEHHKHFLDLYMRALRRSDDQELSTLVTGWVDNSGGRLLAGKFVVATVELPLSPKETAIPASALVEQNGHTFVFVQPDSGKLHYALRHVLVVRRDRDVVHLRSQLTPSEAKQGYQALRSGERVVTRGAAELKRLLEDAGAK